MREEMPIADSVASRYALHLTSHRHTISPVTPPNGALRDDEKWGHYSVYYVHASHRVVREGVAAVQR